MELPDSFINELIYTKNKISDSNYQEQIDGEYILHNSNSLHHTQINLLNQNRNTIKSK